MKSRRKTPKDDEKNKLETVTEIEEPVVIRS